MKHPFRGAVYTGTCARHQTTDHLLINAHVNILRVALQTSKQASIIYHRRASLRRGVKFIFRAFGCTVYCCCRDVPLRGEQIATKEHVRRYYWTYNVSSLLFFLFNSVWQLFMQFFIAGDTWHQKHKRTYEQQFTFNNYNGPDETRHDCSSYNPSFTHAMRWRTRVHSILIVMQTKSTEQYRHRRFIATHSPVETNDLYLHCRPIAIRRIATGRLSIDKRTINTSKTKY